MMLSYPPKISTQETVLHFEKISTQKMQSYFFKEILTQEMQCLSSEIFTQGKTISFLNDTDIHAWDGTTFFGYFNAYSVDLNATEA